MSSMSNVDITCAQVRRTKLIPHHSSCSSCCSCSSSQAASQAAQVVNRQDDSLWPNYVLKTPPPLHAKENQNPHYNV